MLVSVVIPCYNSEHTIGKVVDQCMEEFEKLDGYECEMVLVNDFSADRTYEAIQECARRYPNVKGVNLAKNFGQHCAIMAGLHYAEGAYVVGMDDDLQNHPSQIAQFLEAAEQGYDVVFGTFRERKFSAWKNITGAVSRFLMWHLLERPKNIQMSSFWLARRYVIDKVKEYQGPGAFIQLLFFRTTHNMVNIEIEHYEREVGSSNYTFRKGLKLFLSMINYSIIPLRMASILGVLFSLAGLCGALIVLINKLVRPDVAVGWSSLMCVVLTLFGFSFLLLGILGEYIGKVILTINKSPQYVIRETVNIDEGEETDD